MQIIGRILFKVSASHSSIPEWKQRGKKLKTCCNAVTDLSLNEFCWRGNKKIFPSCCLSPSSTAERMCNYHFPSRFRSFTPFSITFGHRAHNDDKNTHSHCAQNRLGSSPTVRIHTCTLAVGSESLRELSRAVFIPIFYLARYMHFCIWVCLLLVLCQSVEENVIRVAPF